jgi:hypothetical protein
VQGKFLSKDLLVDVVYHQDYRLTAKYGREEWNPVFAIDDDVVPLPQAPQVSEGSKRVNGELAAKPVESYAIQHLHSLAGSVALANPPDFATIAHPAARDLVHIKLGTARPGMRDISPVEDQDPRWMSSPLSWTYIV